MNVILPLTLFLIFLLLFALYSNFKFPFITVLGVLLSAPVGGIVALWITGTPFSASSGIGFLALFGVSVQTAIVSLTLPNRHELAGTTMRTPLEEKAYELFGRDSAKAKELGLYLDLVAEGLPPLPVVSNSQQGSAWALASYSSVGTGRT